MKDISIGIKHKLNDSSLYLFFNFKKRIKYYIFYSKDAFKKCNFDYVIFTRKIWDITIPTLTNAKDELISNLIEQKSIHATDTQIIYLPAPWENFKRRAEEWEDKLQIIKNK